MGILSKLQNYHDAGETAADANLMDFGAPEYSLYTSLKLGDLHRKIEVTDEEGNIKYYTKSGIVSIKGKTDIMDAADNVIAHLEKKIVSLHEKQFITMSDGRNFTLSNELLHVVKDVTNIEGLGWKIQGNIIGLNFNLMDEHDLPIATISKKMISIHDKYCIDLYKPDQEPVVVAVVIALEKMIEARADNSESSGGFSFSLGGNE